MNIFETNRKGGPYESLREFMKKSLVSKEYELEWIYGSNPRNILKKSDISSMLNSIEVRPVFLDDRIVNYALDFQNRSNFNFIKSKIFLKKILRNEIKNYKFKKKHGFAHDFSEWTQEVGIKYLNDNWREIEEVDRFISYLKNNNENEYFISRNVWKFYSLFKWMDLNKVKI